MRIKKVKIGIWKIKDALDDFVKTGEAIERGEEVKREKGFIMKVLKASEKH